MQAVLFCGGQATRMGGGDTPKPMVEIGGKPIVWHIMKYLNYYGVDEFFLALGHKQEYFKEYFTKQLTVNKNINISKDGVVGYFGNGHNERFSINLVDTGEDTLTGGRLRQCFHYLNQIKDSHFIAAYGDVLSDVDINTLIAFAKAKDKTACLTSHRAQSRFGIVTPSEDGTDVESIVEKPIGHDLINIGYFVLKYDILEFLPYHVNKSLEEYSLDILAKEGQLANYEHKGFYQPMDTMKEYTILKDMWDKGDAPWKVW